MTDLSKLQMVFALCVAKFESERGHEVCLLDGVNDFLSEIMTSSSFDDESGVKVAIEGYKSGRFPDESLNGAVAEALTNLVQANVVEMFDEGFERYARRACLPWTLSDDQFEALKSLVAEATAQGDHSSS